MVQVRPGTAVAARTASRTRMWVGSPGAAWALAVPNTHDDRIERLTRRRQRVATFALVPSGSDWPRCDRVVRAKHPYPLGEDLLEDRCRPFML